MPNYARFDTLDDFERFYREEIAPALRDDPDADVDPDRETPTYAWLKRNYSGFVERLRRDYDLSPGDFYDAVGLPPSGDDDDEGDWGIDHEPTAQALDDYLEELERDRGRAETTVGPRRSRLRTYVTTYCETTGTDDLLTPLLDETAKPDEIARVRDTFRVLDDELGTLASKKKYVSAVQNWYTFLEEMGRGLYNPASNLLNRFGWDEDPRYDHPALGRDDLAALLAAADGDERFLLLALAGWGLRPVETCELHVDQLVLDPGDGDVPYVEFAAGERKNARRTRNTVELLVGVDAVRNRIDALDENDAWTGYLLPGQSDGRPMTTETARRWFRELGERADVQVAGGPPLPKMGRRTWYRLYRRQRPSIRAGTAAVASAQGSRDASVSERNYLDERTRRLARADAMRDLVRSELADIFDRYL
ncbi:MULTISPECIES: tyrosine-type recombinase/integrase [Halorussus]|uniref:tyrosine-type recombinase/integrase n=1 Tax=Halorussus TaxID=1070314 RepID=UPI000E213784|nr:MULTISPECIES: tyrosine-type recombinase/integrase [Halorussus]NHN61613.1 phage integrase family protein [Halorussus sp. JP-T4]